jgi:hypothetical protein
VLGDILIVPVAGFGAAALEVGDFAFVAGEVKVAPLPARRVQQFHGESG